MDENPFPELKHAPRVLRIQVERNFKLRGLISAQHILTQNEFDASAAFTDFGDAHRSWGLVLQFEDVKDFLVGDPAKIL
jgi:hypothetical protein